MSSDRVFPLGEELDALREAVRRFAGPDYEVAVVPPEARQLLARFDKRSAHYTVTERKRLGASTMSITGQ